MGIDVLKARRKRRCREKGCNDRHIRGRSRKSVRYGGLGAFAVQKCVVAVAETAPRGAHLNKGDRHDAG